MIYGLQADIDANPGKNVSLFIPGKTKLTPQDVFLGGPGTGIGNDQLNGATRVFGDTAKGTAMALDDYHSDLASQIKAAQASNYAPRIDAAMGMPTGARLDMEITQAQNAIDNPMKAAALTGNFNGMPTLQQKIYDHNVAQDAFTNESYVGNMMGNYQGNDTLDKARLAEQIRQFNASSGSSGRSGGSGGVKPPTAAEQEDYSTSQAMNYLNLWAEGKARDDQGNPLPRATADGIQEWINKNAGALTSQKINLPNFQKWAGDTFTWNPAPVKEAAPYKPGFLEKGGGWFW